MPSVKIYHSDLQIATCSFKYSFTIVKILSGELYWNADEDKGKSGEINIWVQHASTKPGILFVPPDWQLIINGVEFESRLYDGVENLAGKVVELRHQDYRFIFDFS